MANLSSPTAILQKTPDVKRETLNDVRTHEERSARSEELTHFRFLIFDFRFESQIANLKSKIVYALRSLLSALCSMLSAPNPAPDRKVYPHTGHKTQDTRRKTRDIRHKTGDGGSQVSGLKSSLVFLIGIQILLFTFCLQEARPQGVTDREISDLEQQLKGIETQLVSIDGRLRSLNEQFNIVTNEKNKLTQELMEERAKSKGFLDRITGIFGYRSYRKQKKQEGLMTELQDLADRISEHQKKREPLVNEFVALADKLIDKSSLRITDLMEVVREANLNDNVTVRDRAWEQLSALWQLRERTRETRNKYAPIPLSSERTTTFPELLSNDPEELRLGAAILKELASKAREKAAELEREIDDRQRTKLLLERGMELSKEMQRRDEEKGAADAGPTTHIPWASDMAAEREISEIEEEITGLSARKKMHEDNVESFESQSIRLEQRASQIDAKLKERSEDD